MNVQRSFFYDTQLSLSQREDGSKLDPSKLGQSLICRLNSEGEPRSIGGEKFQPTAPDSLESSPYSPDIVTLRTFGRGTNEN